MRCVVTLVSDSLSERPSTEYSFGRTYEPTMCELVCDPPFHRSYQRTEVIVNERSQPPSTMIWGSVFAESHVSFFSPINAICWGNSRSYGAFCIHTLARHAMSHMRAKAAHPSSHQNLDKCQRYSSRNIVVRMATTCATVEGTSNSHQLE